MTVRATGRPPRWRRWTARAGLALCLVAALVVASTQAPLPTDHRSQVDVDVAAALQALEYGDLASLDARLASHRGQPEFAYRFTAETDPRALGDALATVAGEEDALAPEVDAHAYEIALTDLAGTLALATYGTGDRTLPASWTEDFISATTTPEEFHGEVGDDDEAAQARADQDEANKQNLLLLLSRGYWSIDFLQDVTSAYWTFDHDEGEDAWPGVTLDDARYAAAPTGTYLTDGMLALTAALTANPAASAWAFTDFQPNNKEIDGSDYEIGEFAHYLLFEHGFPEGADGDDVGTTAVLTALSSAIDASWGPAGTQAVEAADASSDDVGPVHDTVVLQELAQKVKEGSGCSINPLDYWDCVKAAADAVVDWVKDWGHVVLDILSLATFAPPPFTVIGVAAAATNATWYAIDGDYAMAGLSLATAVPGLAFLKIAKVVKAEETVERAAAEADEVAGVALKVRSGAAALTTRELAVAGAARVETLTQRFARETEAEQYLASRILGSVRQQVFNPPGCLEACLGRRFVDVWVPSSRTAIEVKLGIRNDAYALEEIEKDIALLRDTGTDLKAIEYHFFPDATGEIGPSSPVRELLQSYGIPYVLHQ